MPAAALTAEIWACAAPIARSCQASDRSTSNRSMIFQGDSTVTTVLVEKAGTTTLTATVLYPSREVRDAVIQSGMEHGAAESYDKLAELLANDKVTT